MTVLYQLGESEFCHYCDQEKPVIGGEVITGYLGIILWYCADCLLSVLGRTNV